VTVEYHGVSHLTKATNTQDYSTFERGLFARYASCYEKATTSLRPSNADNKTAYLSSLEDEESHRSLLV